MKNHILFFATFFILNLSFVSAQTNYSKPEEIAQKFLALYYSGDWFNASKLYGNADCEGQITFMVMKMESDEKYVDEGKCGFKIDTCMVNISNGTAICYFTKTCSELKKPKKSHINLKKDGEKWLIDYLWTRDRFF